MPGAGHPPTQQSGVCLPRCPKSADTPHPAGLGPRAAALPPQINRQPAEPPRPAPPSQPPRGHVSPRPRPSRANRDPRPRPVCPLPRLHRPRRRRGRPPRRADRRRRGASRRGPRRPVHPPALERKQLRGRRPQRWCRLLRPARRNPQRAHHPTEAAAALLPRPGRAEGAVSAAASPSGAAPPSPGSPFRPGRPSASPVETAARALEHWLWPGLMGRPPPGPLRAGPHSARRRPRSLPAGQGPPLEPGQEGAGPHRI